MRPGIGLVRPAEQMDAAACLAIYRPYVLDTVVSWEIEVPPVTAMAARIASAQVKHQWLVLEREERVVGFAYAHPLIRLPSYQWSVETGIYVDGEQQRSGAGRLLYSTLLGLLAERGYRRAFAGITQPNEASTGFHRSLGFEPAGLYRRVEYKHGRWHDVAWMQLDLPGATDPDGAPRPID
jgi:L-amino acid N-acyltransferase YncA